MSILHRTKNVVFVSPDEMWELSRETRKSLGKRKMVLGERDNGHFVVIECNSTSQTPTEIIAEDYPTFPADTWEYQDDYGVRILKLTSEEDRFLFKLSG